MFWLVAQEHQLLLERYGNEVLWIRKKRRLMFFTRVFDTRIGVSWGFCRGQVSQRDGSMYNPTSDSNCCVVETGALNTQPKCPRTSLEQRPSWLLHLRAEAIPFEIGRNRCKLWRNLPTPLLPREPRLIKRGMLVITAREPIPLQSQLWVNNCLTTLTILHNITQPYNPCEQQMSSTSHKLRAICNPFASICHSSWVS